jgi:VWFA-related protein
MKEKYSRTLWGVILLCLFFITACGGGGGGETSYTVVAEPKLHLSETSHNFEGVVVNNTADRMFTITNNGNRSGLNINSFSSNTLQFSVPQDGDDCTGKSLAVNASCTFIARFIPTAQSSYNGAISISSNDSKTLSLQGQGYGLNVWINKITPASPQVSIDVTVTNPNAFLATLGEGNFTIRHNDVIVAIDEFTVTDPDPVSVVIALDLSSSLTIALPDIREAAKYFIDRLGDADEAAICKFKEVISLYPSDPPLLEPTDAAGKTDLKAHIDLAFNVTDGTALYEAVYDSITRAAAGTNPKKAVIVLSDGSNKLTTGRTLADVIAYAQAQEIPIFTIYYVDATWAYDAKPAIMKQLADESGGQDYYADRTTMEIIFDQISSLLNKKYTITYTPASFSGSNIPVSVRADSGGLYGVETRAIHLP